MEGGGGDRVLSAHSFLKIIDTCMHVLHMNRKWRKKYSFYESLYVFISQGGEGLERND